MSKRDRIEDPRRDFLVRALAAGLFARGATQSVHAGIFGTVPRKMPAGKSIYRLDGGVMVDGKKANAGTVIGSNSIVETPARGRAVFVVGRDAFLLRGKSRLEISGEGLVVKGLRLLSGKLLSVFGASEHKMWTVTATIGIRGTGLYVEADPEETYACTCYGLTDLVSVGDPDARETVASAHHDAPRYITTAARGGKRIRPAPFKNHTDEELLLIETLVGRRPPFGFSGDGYSAPTRDY